MTDYENALLKVTDALRRHNRPQGGISHKEACRLILEAVRPISEHVVIYENVRDNIQRKCYACSNCRKALVEKVNFCPECGHRLRRTDRW